MRWPAAARGGGRTTYVCNGQSGLTSLVRQEDEPAGANCAFGGRAVLSGPDTDGDGYFR